MNVKLYYINILQMKTYLKLLLLCALFYAMGQPRAVADETVTFDFTQSGYISSGTSSSDPITEGEVTLNFTDDADCYYNNGEGFVRFTW